MPNLCVLVVPSEQLHTQLFWRMCRFQDDVRYRFRAHAPPLRTSMPGQNFSRAMLRRFLRTVRPSEISPIYRRLARVNARFYISYPAGDSETRRHELLHYKFFRLAAYRRRCRAVWRRLPREVRRRVALLLTRDYEYHPAVHLDEFQAFLLTKPLSFWNHASRAQWFQAALRVAKRQLCGRS